ncbi:bone morphogenetic protein 8A-like [Scleropages formosus]|uniref:Bone morphogenetic protein 8A-like n=1 Tax=Scleropages formosus TaxID=113540 RepID=A0A0P7V7E8_SCLFO|nr:bone morphogenetic protein 8A-like [Scleropages formosus]
MQRRLSVRERKEMQREILSILGLPGRPRPHPPLRPPSSAPLFMLDLYHAVSGEAEGEDAPGAAFGPAFGPERLSYAALPTLSTHTPPLGSVVSEADTVMSFVNVDRSLSAGWVGLVGRRGPRSKQPFMVTFFRASQAPCRPPRALRHNGGNNNNHHPRKKKSKYDLPHPNRPGIFDNQVNSGRQACKRHELYDWVLAPQGYSAFYCDGECLYPLGSCMNATNHAMIQLVVHLLKPDEVPKACCAPTKLSPISVLFYDDNNNVILKKHRNMVVKTCGCL